jgi:hypothetical protein
MSHKPKSYTLGQKSLKEIMVELHLNYLHKTQLEMIDEAVDKSDMREAKEVLQYIMEKK